MDDARERFARTIMLRQNPLMYGAASLADIMGVSGRQNNARLLLGLQEGIRSRKQLDLDAAWRHVGESLFWAIDQVDAPSSEGGAS